MALGDAGMMASAGADCLGQSKTQQWRCCLMVAPPNIEKMITLLMKMLASLWISNANAGPWLAIISVSRSKALLHLTILLRVHSKKKEKKEENHTAQYNCLGRLLAGQRLLAGCLCPDTCEDWQQVLRLFLCLPHHKSPDEHKPVVDNITDLLILFFFFLLFFLSLVVICVLVSLSLSNLFIVFPFLFLFMPSFFKILVHKTFLVFCNSSLSAQTFLLKTLV